MSITNSPNMLLPIPSVGTEPGPQYAFALNQALMLVDQHDHSPGSGVQITPAGMNINAVLSMNNNSLTNVESIVFQAQSGIAALQSLYVAPGAESPLTEDLWFRDGNGIAVQITSGGFVNAIIASIPGESYAAGTFFWKQGTGSTTPANFDIGSITIRPNIAATAFGARLTPNPSIASQYDLVLPLLPLSQSVLTLDAVGNILTPTVFPLPAAGLASDSVITAKILDLNVTTAKIANGSITAAKMAAGAVTESKQVFSVSGSFVVPSAVTVLSFEVVGGGGGGAGGGGCDGFGTGAGGGGGGGGVLPYYDSVIVVPGETITVTVGAGGTAGAGGAPGITAGGAGGTGGTSIISGSFGTFRATGGLGGLPGGPGTPGGGARPNLWTPTNLQVASGNGGVGSSSDTGSTVGAGGSASNWQAGAGNGGGVNHGGGEGSGGGGGGGGSGIGLGGNGGNGARADNLLITPGAVGGISAGGGGGGGATNVGGAVPGAAGGVGGVGRVTLFWIG